MAFPSSPTNGQTYTTNGTTYVYDSGMGVWDVQGASTLVSGVTSVAGRTGVVTLTATDVGLANVTNESKATMFSGPTFTGTTTAGALTAGAITATSLSLSGTLTASSLTGISAINSVAIGSSTPSSGAFTTLSASTSITGNLTGNVTGNLTGNVTGNVTGNLTGAVTASTLSASGAVTLSAGGTAVSLSHGTNNRISWGATGVASPAFTTYSNGVKLVLYDNIGASSAGYTIGIDSSTMFFTTDSASSGGFKMFGGTTMYTQTNNAGLYVATSLGVGTAASGTTGEGRFTNAITAYYSDERLKNKISTIENALDKIDQLTGFLYIENDVARRFGFNNPNKQVALSAQDVKRVQPEAVKPAPFDIAQREDGTEYSKSGENYLTVDYEKLIPLLVEGIKELRKEINQLKGK
jgi:hypothetical protein